MRTPIAILYTLSDLSLHCLKRIMICSLVFFRIFSRRYSVFALLCDDIQGTHCDDPRCLLGHARFLSEKCTGFVKMK